MAAAAPAQHRGLPAMLVLLGSERVQALAAAPVQGYIKQKGFI